MCPTEARREASYQIRLLPFALTVLAALLYGDGSSVLPPETARASPQPSETTLLQWLARR